MATYVPQDNTPVFSPPPGMFPCAMGKLSIDDAACAAVGAGIEGSDPGVDDQTGAGLEAVGPCRGVAGVQGVEEGGGRDLL